MHLAKKPNAYFRKFASLSVCFLALAGSANAYTFQSLKADGYKASRMTTNRIGSLGWKMTKPGQPTIFCNFNGLAVFGDDMKGLKSGNPSPRYTDGCLPFRP